MPVRLLFPVKIVEVPKQIAVGLAVAPTTGMGFTVRVNVVELLHPAGERPVTV